MGVDVKWVGGGGKCAYVFWPVLGGCDDNCLGVGVYVWVRVIVCP